jgi:hypothetical protein
MDTYEELPDLRMTALAALIYIKWRSKETNKPNSFVVKEALAKFASRLEDNDIGYFYDPASPREFCVNPGHLVGKISNCNLPYTLDFKRGVEHVANMLKAVDSNDYIKTGIIISDCLEKKDVDSVCEIISKVDDAKFYVFTIGNKGSSFEGAIQIDDASRLGDKLLGICDDF